MVTRRLEADYLVVGAGAAGMAFTDALIADADVDVIMVDRRHAPGGHWNDAYPFVRLHQPSAYYGVNSLPLGDDSIDDEGLNAGMYEQANAAEICGYYDRVMRRSLLPSGSVRYHPMCEVVGDGRFVSRVSGDEFEVDVRTAVVDAAYLEPSIPATFAPPFAVASGVRCIPVNALSNVTEPAGRFVVIGAGKTAIDACLWLLQTGVEPDAIRWIKPREAWLRNRRHAQGGELVGDLIDGIALQLEAAAQATSADDLFDRLELHGLLLRVDERVTPTMYKAPTMSTAELELLKRIDDVVRLGHVRRIDRGEVVLDGGTVAAQPGDLYVHCAAPGLNPAPAVPIFVEGRITLQPIRTGLIPFNAALVGYVEATGRDIREKNRLCPPNRLPDVPLDWVRGLLIEMGADRAWSKESDIARWLEGARLNTSCGLRQRADEPRVQDAMARFRAFVRPGLDRLGALLASR
ncbi:NAD(P)-binding protein [Agromyces sp. NPDC058484]|uniref:NAD(P)-binding protein n=1 Tax=Agromyces sp. NPDC058484 TaxID=3346524 RepID=UPI0036472496